MAEIDDVCDHHTRVGQEVFGNGNCKCRSGFTYFELVIEEINWIIATVKSVFERRARDKTWEKPTVEEWKIKRQQKVGRRSQKLEGTKSLSCVGNQQVVKKS